ncbi:hypothetical protein [Streptomyces flaveolus]|uniref:hypothetical protein n=1 Tax=Streptomyces flaveolus TaxID=67297 RepID=UPI0036F61C3A
MTDPGSTRLSSGPATTSGGVGEALPGKATVVVAVVATSAVSVAPVADSEPPSGLIAAPTAAACARRFCLWFCLWPDSGMANPPSTAIRPLPRTLPPWQAAAPPVLFLSRTPGGCEGLRMTCEREAFQGLRERFRVIFGNAVMEYQIPLTKAE